MAAPTWNRNLKNELTDTVVSQVLSKKKCNISKTDRTFLQCSRNIILTDHVIGELGINSLMNEKYDIQLRCQKHNLLGRAI